MKTLPLTEVLAKVTPLPWRPALGVCNPDKLWGGPDENETAVARCIDRDADFAYLAHAANVLPELAHGLAQLRRCLDGSQPKDVPGAVMALDYLIHRASSVPVN